MIKTIVKSCAVAVAFMGLATLAADGIAVKNGEKIAFLGDSITQFAANTPGGYVHLVISGLKANGVNATAIPAGITGDESDEMLARLKPAVLDKKPDWVTLSCGVNDVLHGCGVKGGVSLEDYKKNITAIVDQCQTAKVKVMVLTSTMINENPKNLLNQGLIPYNEFLRALAKERNLPLADLNADMQEEVKQAVAAGIKGDALTNGGVHMAPSGNQMMAIGVLKGFGVTPEELAKAKETWLDIPAACEMACKTKITIRQYRQLTDKAIKKGKPVQVLLDDAFIKGLEKRLQDNK